MLMLRKPPLVSVPSLMAVAAHHAVADADVLAQSRRSALQGDAVVVAIGQHALHNDLMTAVQVERIVVVVVAVEHLDVLYFQSVAGQVVLHPAARVAQRHVADGDVLALDEANKVGPRDALVVPRELLKGPSAPVDGARSAQHNVLHAVGINQLHRLRLRAQRHVVALHGAVVVQVGRAEERCPML